MQKQLLARCSDILDLEGNNRRKSELTPLRTWPKDFENLVVRHFQYRYTTLLDCDGLQSEHA